MWCRSRVVLEHLAGTYCNLEQVVERREVCIKRFWHATEVPPNFPQATRAELRSLPVLNTLPALDMVNSVYFLK